MPEVHLSTQDIDVDDILKVSVDYGKLSIVLKSIFDRLSALEADRPAANVDASHERTPEQRDDRIHNNAEQRDHTPTDAGQRDEIKSNDSRPSDAPATAGSDSAIPPVDLEPRVIALEKALSHLQGTLTHQSPPQTQPPSAADDRLAGLEARVAALEAAAADAQPRGSIAPDGLAALQKAHEDLQRQLDGLKVAQADRLLAAEPDGAPSAETHSNLADRVRAVEGALAALGHIHSNDQPIQSTAPTEAAEAQLSDGEGSLEERLRAYVLSLQPAASANPQRPENDDRLCALELTMGAIKHEVGGLADASDTLRNDSLRLNRGLEDCDRELHELGNRFRLLEGQLRVIAEHRQETSAASAVPRMGDEEPNSSLQYQLMQATLHALQQGLNELQLRVRDNQADCLRADENLANRTAHLEQRAQNTEDALASLQRRVDDLAGHFSSTTVPQLLRLQEQTKHLADTKANRADLPQRNEAGVPRDVFDAALDELRRKMSAMEARLTVGAKSDFDAELKDLQTRVAVMEARPVEASAERAPAQVDVLAEERMMRLVADAAESARRNNEQIIEIRATIDHIHHSKADATLVANKAERDYVENALEKLMREVEQVMNATNAGLIDTLDKSLGILRDMIDGKASKADLNRLRAANAEDVGTVPEGLAGYKSYRCLGCNRTVDAMRSRPMGANFSNFMNRLPQSTSPRQASVPPRTAEGSTRNYLTAGPHQ